MTSAIVFAEEYFRLRGYSMWNGRKVRVIHAGGPCAETPQTQREASRTDRKVQKIEIKTLPEGGVGGED